MITKTTKEIEAVFQAQKWNYSIDEHPNGTTSALVTGFDLKSGRSLQILFISNDTGETPDLAIRAFEFFSVPAGKEGKALEACNQANNEFRFAKFALLGNGNIAVEVDMPAEVQNVGAVAVELLYRLLDIADNACPIFEKALSPTSAPADSPNGERY